MEVDWYSVIKKIEIAPYQSEWCAEFDEIAHNLRAVVGAIAVRIDHIGSTSVAGLAAKDVIDIQLTVAQLPQTKVVSLLKGEGYRIQLQASFDNLVGMSNQSAELRKLFFREPENQRRTHVHVREEGRVNQLYPLLFRDYLRAEPSVRLAYQTIKLELAARFAEDVEAYYAIKDPVMDAIYQAALLWKDKVGWEPDSRFV